MSERDRQNPYDRSTQQGGNHRNDYDSPRQANQWQTDDNRQQGGYWQQDGSRGDDTSREYRFSGQGNASYDAGYQSDRDSQRGRYGSSNQQDGGRYGQQQYGRSQSDYGRNDYGRSESGQGRSEQGRYGREQYGSSSYGQNRYDQDRYGQGRDERGQQSGSRGRYGSQQSGTLYSGRNYDASGGNDFGDFTSEDYGGRDFSNRGGSVSGGMSPSDSYRPTYSAARLFDHDGDRDRNRDGGREDRGFLARAGDEVASWFGDDEAQRRRDQDRREDHRGRGPSGYTRSDERIKEDANDHLTHDWGVDASHITVSVSNGEITLDGTVDSRQAKRRAEDCVEHISGVKHVQNNLRVQDRSSSYGSTGAQGASSSGQGSSQSALSGGSSASSGLSGTSGSSTNGATSTGSTTGAPTSGSSATGGSSTSGSTGSSTTGTGASTTGGIGSSATAGVGGASAPRSSDKTS